MTTVLTCATIEQMDKYEQLKQFLVNTDNGRLVKYFESDLKDKELADLKRIVAEKVSVASLEVLVRVNAVLADAVHPLDEVIEWVNSLDKYSHKARECVTSHFATGMVNIEEKFSKKFNVSLDDAIALYFGHFHKINPKFENYNSTLLSESRIDQVDKPLILEVLYFLKEKHPV